MTLSDKTIRIQNTDPQRRQLSMQLALASPKVAPRLRRGVTLMPICIPVGRYYDVCKELDVDFGEAQRIVDQSHEVLAHKRHNRVLIYEFPPSAADEAEQTKRAADEAASIEKTAALNPPDPPDAVPAGVDLEAAGFDPSNPPPRQTFSPFTTVAPTSVESAVETEEPEQIVVPTPQPKAAAVVEPSMAWTLEALRSFAEEQKIDLGSDTTKTQVLKRIRKAMAK